MGRATAPVLVSSLLDDMYSCVFLVPARTVNGTAHIVSSLRDISLIVSIQHNLSHFLFAGKIKNNHYFIFLFRVWLLRKMLFVIFSRRTEKNSKVFFLLINMLLHIFFNCVEFSNISFPQMKN